MSKTTKQCDRCEREGKLYIERFTSYEERGVKTYHNEVIRCGYHHRNTNYSSCALVEAEN